MIKTPIYFAETAFYFFQNPLLADNASLVLRAEEVVIHENKTLFDRLHRLFQQLFVILEAELKDKNAVRHT